MRARGAKENAELFATVERRQRRLARGKIGRCCRVQVAFFAHSRAATVRRFSAARARARARRL